MIYLLDVMEPEQALKLANTVDRRGDWTDGKLTAGDLIKDRKDNEQLILAPENAMVQTAAKALMHEKVSSAIGPFRLQPPRFSRYQTDQHYDWHIDNALLPDNSRCDVSMTLMLRSVTTGGHIEIKVGGVHMVFAPRPGQALVWASHLEHRVTPVHQSDGTRIVALGFGTCAIADPIAREIIQRQALVNTAELDPQQRADSSFALTNNQRLWVQRFT